MFFSVPEEFTGHEELGEVLLLELEFPQKPDGTYVSKEHVSEYLRSRRIIAGIADPTVIGITGAVQATLAVLSQEHIAVVGLDGKVSTGQVVEEFLSGMAYTLGTPISANSEVVYLEDGSLTDETFYDDTPVTAQSINFMNDSSPSSALLPLFEADPPGAFGYADSKVFFTTFDHYLTDSTVAAHKKSLPMFVFRRLGTAKVFELFLTNSGIPDLTLFRIKDGELAFNSNTSTPALEALNEWVTKHPEVEESPEFTLLTDNPDNIKVPKKYLPHVSLARKLAQQKEHIAQAPEHEYFTKIAEQLNLGPQATRIIGEFDAAPLGNQPVTHIGQHPLTQVAPLTDASLTKSIARVTPYEIVHEMARNFVERNNKMDRLRKNKKVYAWVVTIYATFSTLFITAIIAAAVNPHVARTLDITSFGDYLWFSILPIVFTACTIVLLTQKRWYRAQKKFLQDSYNEVVYPYPID